jgi:mannose-6-phosphate isomerase-like protein (cupin superfamily)
MALLLGISAAALAGSAATAQMQTEPAGAAPARAPAEPWWVEKTQGGVYRPPMKPLWRLADLKKMHAGQNDWRQHIILDPEQDATYNSAAPGTKFGPRIHPDTPTVFVVIAGSVRFDVEGQQPIVATRGSIINIMKTTVFSYAANGGENALWVEVNPTNYKTLYPASASQPKPMIGGQVIKVAFAHKPAPYEGINQLHYNIFEGIARCDKPAARVRDDHLFASPLLGWVNADDNPCKTGRLNVGNAPVPGSAATLPPFDPRSNFGHMHAGPAEWWIVQVGRIVGRFENQGEFHAEEGDVLYAAPMMWHQMAAEAASGPSVRLAMGGYELINMNNTGGE